MLRELNMLGAEPVAVAYILVSLAVGAVNSVICVIGTDLCSLNQPAKAESRKTHASMGVFCVHVVDVLLQYGLTEKGAGVSCGLLYDSTVFGLIVVRPFWGSIRNE